MKLESSMSNLLTNKLVLNVVAFIAIFNVFGYAIMGNVNKVFYFILIAVLVRLFSKNMIIVLGVPLLIVNLLSTNVNIIEDMDNADNVYNEELIMNEIPDTVMIENIPSQITSTDQEGFEPGRNKKGTYNIDDAKQIDDAYNILGSDKNLDLTSDTQFFIDQQKQLQEMMGENTEYKL
jgi:hypothetical protein